MGYVCVYVCTWWKKSCKAGEARFEGLATGAKVRNRYRDSILRFRSGQALTADAASLGMTRWGM